MTRIVSLCTIDGPLIRRLMTGEGVVITGKLRYLK